MPEYHTNLIGLRDRVTVAEYTVDPVAVTDAIVGRRWSVAVAQHAGARSPGGSRRLSRSRVSCIARHVRNSATSALAA